MNIAISSSAALAIAILTEVAGTTFLQLSEQLTRLVLTVVMGVCYLASLYFLSLALKTIPIGIAYAIWSGMAPFSGRLGRVAFLRHGSFASHHLYAAGRKPAYNTRAQRSRKGGMHT
jgi:multidrug transporter EmrE-like cation transporter